MTEAQFSDEAVRDRTIASVRKRVSAAVDRSLAEDQARIVIALENGRRLEKFIEHAIGSSKRPMTDSQLEGKFSDLADGILPRDQIRKTMDLCWQVEKLADAAAIAHSAAL